MPGVIAVSDFVRETREDINSPTTSTFINRIPQCKETVVKLEEVRLLFEIACVVMPLQVRRRLQKATLRLEPGP